MRSDEPMTGGWQLADAGEWSDLRAVLRGEESGGTWYDVDLPSGVHEVMLREGRIPDPHLSRNAAEADWVGDHDWVFRTRFTTPEATEGGTRLVLRGVDTLAEVWLNGTRVAELDDMFLEHVLPVTEALAPVGEENVLAVLVRSAGRFVDTLDQPPEQREDIRPSWYLRKGGGDFGNYLGARPRLVKAGIYRDVVLSRTDAAWIEDVRVVTRLAGSGAEVDVRAGLAGSAAGQLRWRLVDPAGQLVVDGVQPARDARWTVPVATPELWWPRGQGGQPLYRLTVDLVDDAGHDQDTREVVVGIREVELVTERDGEACFQLHVNGRPVFLRGANWTQVEGITNVWDHDRAMRLLDLSEHAEMNLLRVWGGGIIPEPDFYAECDRRGLLVWQDFMFEYGMYPTDLPDYAATVERELVDVVRRLRNHPCIALWCGGNENHMGWDFQHRTPPAIGTALFDEVMPRICAEHDGTRPFHPNSPFGGPAPDWPLVGDWHDYTTLTYSHRAAVPTFVSETGRVSAPVLRSMRRFLEPQELWPDDHDPVIRRPGEPSWPPMWGYRAPDLAWSKIGAIEQYLEPHDAASFVRVLGTAHGEYLQRSVERHRRGLADGEGPMPGDAPAGPVRRRNGGDLVWRLNDPWPILYWSVVDSYLEPKIAYHYLRRAYDPVLISFEQTADRLTAWVTNDTAAPVSDRLVVRRTRFDGTVVGALERAVTVGPGESVPVVETADLGPIVLRSELLVAEFGGRTVSRLLLGERYLELPEADLQVRVEDDVLVVGSDVFVRQVMVDWDDALTGLRVDDDCFDLLPHQERRIRLTGRSGAAGTLTVAALNAAPVRVAVG